MKEHNMEWLKSAALQNKVSFLRKLLDHRKCLHTCGMDHREFRCLLSFLLSAAAKLLHCRKCLYMYKYSTDHREFWSLVQLNLSFLLSLATKWLRSGELSLDGSSTHADKIAFLYTEAVYILQCFHVLENIFLLLYLATENMLKLLEVVFEDVYIYKDVHLTSSLQFFDKQQTLMGEAVLDLNFSMGTVHRFCKDLLREYQERPFGFDPSYIDNLQTEPALDIIFGDDTIVIPVIKEKPDGKKFYDQFMYFCRRSVTEEQGPSPPSTSKNASTLRAIVRALADNIKIGLNEFIQKNTAICAIKRYVRAQSEVKWRDKIENTSGDGNLSQMGGRLCPEGASSSTEVALQGLPRPPIAKQKSTSNEDGVEVPGSSHSEFEIDDCELMNVASEVLHSVGDDWAGLLNYVNFTKAEEDTIHAEPQDEQKMLRLLTLWKPRCVGNPRIQLADLLKRLHCKLEPLAYRIVHSRV